mmetsp:Transcript_19990/g.55541  ORF Transcript_19990/g.55541 Transcript_19990/m.55541 type:complete len:238 (+) Transcript_19990:147-860(+)|eukprot:CAMPEP_0117668860 /NCGR_PEP_ID=MMETSP0804-20121206/11792_1 /TAXON_ID=1074897 /ORGANISM="Tetraselmis astigmatica, Strain CCMP880" /LENGTH=237 /DNA_ID=CAMNT_0005476815 /DNA_START=133 /DNA_END=846 /DNA_ORIENTATION=-
MILQSFRPGAGVAPVTVTLRSSLGLRVLSPKTISSNGVPPVQTCKQSGSGPRSLSRSAGRLKRFVALGQATDSQSSEPSIQPSSVWEQKIITLPAYNRGCHVVTRKLLEQLPELLEFEVGMANLFIQHTSASLTINENASPDVPKDLNDSLDKIVPEGNWYRHLDEGMDDMPAHVKSSLMGPSLDLPIRAGRLALGTWQGIYLNEHRNYGGARTIVITLQGCKRADGRKYPANQSRW